MNLNITVNQLLSNPKAREILAREFPQMVNSPLIRLYGNASVKKVLSMIKGKVPDEKIQRIVTELESI